ncbi:MAG: M15 family metallopeptidase [Chitinophagales bacterium]|nr:M15 family metallopeptidase [Chitinophagales bacterium]
MQRFFPIPLAFLLLFACNHTPNPVPVAATNNAPQPAPPPELSPEMRNYLLGKFNPAERTDFVTVGAPYSDRAGMQLRQECFEAFKKMYEAAKKDGHTLKIISSTRTFAQQKGIWEGKWQRFAAEAPEAQARALKILEYSSMPGSSRHHWGTDIDLNDLNNPAFEGKGKYAKLYEWLQAHAHEYGFCQPYTAGRPHGYFEEKWHWSYTPISQKLLEQYRSHLKDEDIQGFIGAETAKSIGIVQHYVLGINDACK